MGGFTTGLGSPTMLSRTNYYIEDGGGVPPNPWDANTYLNLTFDSSGSMNDIISPLTACVNCTYLASPGVKADYCLRADLQDFYATGATEESGNTDASTNGSDAYEAHVGYRIVADERYLTWFENYYPARTTANPSAGFAGHSTWNALGNAATVNNIVQVTVCNESTPAGCSVSHNTRYQRSIFGGPETVTVTATVNGATTSSANFTSDDDYNPFGASPTLDKLTHHGAAGWATDNSNRMYLVGRSSAGSITSNTYITNTSNTTVTLNNAHSFLDNEVLTFQVDQPGIDMTTMDMPDYTRDIVALRESIIPGDVTAGTMHASGFDPGDGLSGLGVAGETPSIHWIHIDPGVGSTPGSRVTGGTCADQPRGPQVTPANAPGTSYTGPQRMAIEGVKNGMGIYGAPTNYSVNDWNTQLNAWNGKSNTFVVVPLIEQSSNTSQAFWYAQLVAAISMGMNI